MSTTGAATVIDDETAVVTLGIPALPEYLRLARYAAADAAARAGFDVDVVDDVRLAVSELCGLLARPDASVHLELRSSPDTVVVDGTGTPGDALQSESGELATTLVRALVDEFTFVVDGEDARFHIVIRRPSETPKEQVR